MENGVRGEAGISVQRHVVEEQGHDIDLVTLHHQTLSVFLAMDWDLKRNHALKLSDAQVFR